MANNIRIKKTTRYEIVKVDFSSFPCAEEVVCSYTNKEEASIVVHALNRQALFDMNTGYTLRVKRGA